MKNQESDRYRGGTLLEGFLLLLSDHPERKPLLPVQEAASTS